MQSAASALIGAFKVKEDTFTIELNQTDDNGNVQTFRVVVRSLKGVPQLTQLKVRSQKFYKMCKGHPLPEYKEILKTLELDEATAEMVCELTDLVIEPKFNVVDALTMARDAGPALAYIHGQIMERVGYNSGAAEAEDLERRKKLSR